MNKQRGIIYCPYFKESYGDVYIPHVQIHNAELQFFCLYWDFIIQPVSEQLPLWKRSTNEIVLEDAGILIKDYQETSEKGPILSVEENAYSIKSEGAHEWVPKFMAFQSQSLEKAKTERPNVIWTPQQSLSKIETAPNLADNVHCIQINLHKKLPVPSDSATIKKIVKFKYENTELFNELKLYIDRLTHFVSQADTENEYSLNLAINDIEKITKEIEISSKQRFGKLVKFESVKINIGSSKLSSNFFKGAAFSGLASSDPFISLIGGLGNSATSFINIEPKETKRLHCIPEGQIELGYVTRGFNQGILKSI